MGAGKGCARHGAHSPSRLFYDCNRYRYSAHTVCSSHYIRHERLLAAVTDALDQQLALAVDVERLIHEIDHSAELTQAKQEKQNTATSLRLQRQGLDRKLDIRTSLSFHGSYIFSPAAPCKKRHRKRRQETRQACCNPISSAAAAETIW